MNPIIILHAGLAAGTVLLFATIGELLTERSGILNLGVEGMRGGFCPVNPSPKTSARPVPKKVSDRPLTTWSA